MVLKIFDRDGKTHLYDKIDDTFFVTESYGGMNKLQFDVSPDHPLYFVMQEETRVEFENQYYLIKGINERKTVTTINCELDLTGLRKNFYKTYNKKTESFYNVCREILSGTGWQIVNAELIAPRRSLELTDVTTYDILNQCTNTTTYSAVYRFDTKNRKIYIIKPQNNTKPTGTYFTDELNLSDLTFKGSSDGIVTRLYVYGKDGLSIASVNGGKEYIDNNSYSDKIISAVWRDERYTNPQELKDDAVVKLAAMSNPERSYTCKVDDLAKQCPAEYSMLKFDLYDVITLIDRKRKQRINHRIIEYKRYPSNASLNTVTLSTMTGTVTGKMTAINNKVNELNAQQLHDRTKVNEIKQDLDTTVLHVSKSWASSVNESLFTQTSEGLFFQVDKIVGTNRFGTLIQQSATDVQIAWNNCSNYIKFENAQLNIYDLYANLQMSLNKNGQEFYYKGNYIGKAGTNCWVENEDVRGIVFDLDTSGSYMTWAYKESSSSNYIMKLTYIGQRFGSFIGDTIYCGCPIDMDNYKLKNPNLENWNFSGGSISGTLSFEAPTSIRTSDGTVATWRTVSLTFKNGILQSATW